MANLRIEFIGTKYANPKAVLDAFYSRMAFRTIDGRYLKIIDLPKGTEVTLRYKNGVVKIVTR